MVHEFKNGNGVMVRFGSGTVRVRDYTLKNRYGGQIELTSCAKTELGKDPGDPFKRTSKVVLDFANTQSIDVVIKKLQDLKKDLEAESGERV